MGDILEIVNCGYEVAVEVIYQASLDGFFVIVSAIKQIGVSNDL